MMSLYDKKLMVVDDDELLAKAYNRKLSKLGFKKVTTFYNGTDCINALTSDPFIIFLDYNMEDVDGFDVLRKIKRTNPNIYVIIMSSQKDIANAVRTLKFGAFDYIVKGEHDSVNMESALHRIELMEQQLLVPRQSLFTRIINLF